MMSRSCQPGLLVVLAALFLTACASHPPWPDQAAESVSPTLPGTKVLHQVPFHPQERYQCGPAALASMLNAQGIDVTPETLVPKVYLPERQGSLQVEMVAAARQYGLLAYPLAPDIEAILTEVEQGHPVLVLQNLRFDWWPQWHFAVVVGFDAKEEDLILHSGTEPFYRQPLPAFWTTWARGGHWARVMLPPDQLPATAEPLPYLESAYDLEATGQLDAASTAYQTAVSAWPDQPAAWLGQGNVAYQQQRWDAAATAYGEMTERFPDIAIGWHNFAEALAIQGFEDASRRARTCAAELNPERFPVPKQSPPSSMEMPSACKPGALPGH